MNEHYFFTSETGKQDGGLCLSFFPEYSDTLLTTAYWLLQIFINLMLQVDNLPGKVDLNDDYVKSLLSWTARFQRYWKASPYLLEKKGLKGGKH